MNRKKEIRQIKEWDGKLQRKHNNEKKEEIKLKKLNEEREKKRKLTNKEDKTKENAMN